MKFQTIRTEGVKRINYTKSIDSYQHQVAPLLLITIIENAFKHSVLNSKINVNIKLEDGILNFKCQNDFDKEKVTTTDLKIGLQNLEKRLELIYKDRYTFTINNNDRFTVNLKLDLKESF
jgi:LytS/YehU family sensor histidine kinase